MKRSYTTLAGRSAFGAATLAALAGAAFLGTFLLRDAIAPAEAKAGPRQGPASSARAGAARVRIEAVGTQRAGITGRPRVSQANTLPVGDTVVWFLRAGGQDHDFCATEFKDAPFNDYLVLWRVQVTTLDAGGGQSTVQVHWTRSRAGAVERDQTRTITLGPTDTHVLDYVENETKPASPCASLLVRVGAQPLASGVAQPVTVDLWTVDQNPAGNVKSVHERVQGTSGDAIAYRLPPLDFVSDDGAPANVRTEVSGSVVAMPAADGLVDVTLTTMRQSASDRATIRGEGRVQFRSKPGETAAVLLPDPAGRLAIASGSPSIDLGRLFAGHRMSLYVKVDTTR